MENPDANCFVVYFHGGQTCKRSLTLLGAFSKCALLLSILRICNRLPMAALPHFHRHVNGEITKMHFPPDFAAAADRA